MAAAVAAEAAAVAAVAVAVAAAVVVAAAWQGLGVWRRRGPPGCGAAGRRGAAPRAAGVRAGRGRLRGGQGRAP